MDYRLKEATGLVPAGNGDVALPDTDGQQVSDSSDLLLDGNVVLKQLPDQTLEIKLRTADALKSVSGSLQPHFDMVLLNSVIEAMPLFPTVIRRGKGTLLAG